MIDLLRRVILSELAQDFFEEAIDEEMASVLTNAPHGRSMDLDGFAEGVLSRLDDAWLDAHDVRFTDDDIEYFKQVAIPEELKTRLRKFNMEANVTVKNRTLFIGVI